MALDLVRQLAMAHATFDALGVERGDNLEVRLAWLRGAMSQVPFRWATGPAPKADPDADLQPRFPVREPPAGPSTTEPLADALDHEPTEEVAVIVLDRPTSTIAVNDVERAVGRVLREKDEDGNDTVNAAAIRASRATAEITVQVTVDPATAAKLEAGLVEVHRAADAALAAAADRLPAEDAAAITRITEALDGKRVHPGTDIPFDLEQVEPKKPVSGGPYKPPERTKEEKAADRLIAKTAKADARAAEKAARQAEYDPSWRAGGNRAFFAALADLPNPITDKYEVIAAFAQSRNRPRPSRMTEVQRDKFIAAFKLEKCRTEYDEWVASHSDAVVAEIAPTVDIAAELDTPEEWDTTEGEA